MEAGVASATKSAIYRADVVGSLLRPPWLIQARQELRVGSLALEVCKDIEDRAVAEAIAIQEQAGVDVVTGGEIRRDIFFDLFVNGMTGFSRAVAYTVRFHGKEAEDAMEVQVPFAVTDKVQARSLPALEEFLAVKGQTKRPVKVTLPRPMLIGGFWSAEHSRDAYQDPFALFAEAAQVVQRWVRGSSTPDADTSLAGLTLTGVVHSGDSSLGLHAFGVAILVVVAGYGRDARLSDRV